jgi:hypothetical protein
MSNPPSRPCIDAPENPQPPILDVLDDRGGWRASGCAKQDDSGMCRDHVDRLIDRAEQAHAGIGH